MPDVQEHHDQHWRPSPDALLAHLHHPRPVGFAVDPLCASTPPGDRLRRWHRGSIFGEGLRRPLTHDQRRAWLARAEQERRAGNLTTLHVEVARALLKHLGTDGRCDPAQATLAADAGCGERTVRRALAALRALGLLAWEQRLVRRPWPEGGAGASRAEQTSNAYALLLPTGPVTAREQRQNRPVQLRLGCAGQPGRETPSEMSSKRVPPFDPAAKKALQEIAAARAMQFQQEWLARHAQRWGRSGHAGPS